MVLAITSNDIFQKYWVIRITGICRSMAFTHIGLVSGMHDESTRIWNASTNQQLISHTPRPEIAYLRPVTLAVLNTPNTTSYKSSWLFHSCKYKNFRDLSLNSRGLIGF